MMNSPKPIVFITIAAIVLISIFIGYAQRATVYAELNSLKLIPQPERFTELYFANSYALPTQTVKGQPISFSFTINNMEGTSTVYPYEVYFQDAQGAKTVIASNTVSIPDGNSATITVSYIFEQSGEQGTVVVDLTSLNNQQIDFHL